MTATTDRRFVVISGLPGSGKSVLGRMLAPLLRLPSLDKDDILDRLFQARGVGDAEWRRQLSRESDAILQADAIASEGAFLISFWHLPGMPPDSGTPTSWLACLSPALVHVHCVCPPRLAADRFMKRQRHAGHLDRDRADSEILASLESLAALEPLRAGERIDVNTESAPSPSQIAVEIEAAFTRSIGGRAWTRSE